MAGLITIPNRDMNGIEDLNNNFSYLETMAKQAIAEGGSKGEFHNWSKDGIVMHNGFTLSYDSGYRYWKFPTGQKLVEITIHSTLTSDNFHGGEWFTLPDFIQPESSQLYESLVNTYYVMQGAAANTINVNSTATTPFDHGSWDYTLHTMYFSN